MIVNELVSDLISERSTSEDARSDLCEFETQGKCDLIRLLFPTELDLCSSPDRFAIVIVSMERRQDGAVDRARKALCIFGRVYFEAPLARRLETYARSDSADSFEVPQ